MGANSPPLAMPSWWWWTKGRLKIEPDSDKLTEKLKKADNEVKNKNNHNDHDIENVCFPKKLWTFWLFRSSWGWAKIYLLWNKANTRVNEVWEWESRLEGRRYTGKPETREVRKGREWGQAKRLCGRPEKRFLVVPIRKIKWFFSSIHISSACEQDQING